MAIDTADRHPATAQIVRWFSSSHLPDDLRPIAEACEDLAAEMLLVLPDGPELTAGLRKLLEAKDCFVRAQVDTR